MATVNRKVLPDRLQLYVIGRKLVKECQFITRHYPAGRTIFHQGYEQPRAFLIQSGWSRLHRDLADGRCQIVEIPIAGDFVGLFSGRRVRNESFSSITPLVVWEGCSAAVGGLMAVPSWASQYIDTALARQRTAITEHLASLGKRSAAVRMVHFFLELGERLEFAGQDLRDSFACPLTQKDIADLLGLTSIYVNQMLRELREGNILVFRQGRVKFLDYEAGVRFAAFEKVYFS